MKNFLKLAVFSAFLATGFVMFSINPTAAGSVSPVEDNGDNAGSPRTLYVQNCATCHGSNGKSQTARGRKLEADDLTTSEAKGLSTARIIRLISNGKGKMPAFRRKLTGAQIESIAGYIRSL